MVENVEGTSVKLSAKTDQTNIVNEVHFLGLARNWANPTRYGQTEQVN